ncbi:hypothetical protein [Candidatus Hodarchaeum mangrovi]
MSQKQPPAQNILRNIINEVDETISTTILDRLAKIQQSVNTIIAIFNHSEDDLRQTLFILINSLFNFNQTIIEFPEELRKKSDYIIKKQIKSNLQIIKKTLKKLDMLFWITRHRHDDLFPVSHPVLDYMEESIQIVLTFLKNMRQEFQITLNSIITELDSLLNEIDEAKSYIGAVPPNIVSQFFIDSIMIWDQDMKTLLQYWEDKLQTYEKKFCIEMESMDKEQQRLTLFINQEIFAQKKRKESRFD